MRVIDVELSSVSKTDIAKYEVRIIDAVAREWPESFQCKVQISVPSYRMSAELVVQLPETTLAEIRMDHLLIESKLLQQMMDMNSNFSKLLSHKIDLIKKLM